MVQGNNIIISRKEGNTWVAIASSKSMSIQVDAEQVEKSSPTTGLWRDDMVYLKLIARRRHP